MASRKTVGQLAKRRWTRAEQKKRIYALFELRYSKGFFNQMTAQEIANRLEMLDASYMKELCLEMVVEGILDTGTAIHRVMKNGNVIIKSYFLPICSNELKERYFESQSSLAQLSWLDGI